MLALFIVLACCRSTTCAVQAAKQQHTPNHCSLDLKPVPPRSLSFHDLCRVARLRRLESLTLAGCHLSGIGLVDLEPAARTLRELDLSRWTQVSCQPFSTCDDERKGPLRATVDWRPTESRDRSPAPALCASWTPAAGCKSVFDWCQQRHRTLMNPVVMAARLHGVGLGKPAGCTLLCWSQLPSWHGARVMSRGCVS